MLFPYFCILILKSELKGDILVFSHLILTVTCGKSGKRDTRELFLAEAPVNFNPFKLTMFSNFVSGLLILSSGLFQTFYVNHKKKITGKIICILNPIIT